MKTGHLPPRTWFAVASAACLLAVPALALVKDRRVVARLDGRVTTPRLEEMLDSHLRAFA